MNNPNKQVYRFGMGKRESLKIKKQTTPGPQYDVRGTFGEGVGTVKMNSKTKRSFNLATNSDIPGPGDYVNQPPEGFLSKEKKFVSFSLGRSRRFKPDVKSSSPGPGEHGSIDFNTSGPSFTIYPKLEDGNRYFSKSLFKTKPIEVKNSEKIFEKDDFMYELEHYKPYATFGFGNRSDFTAAQYDNEDTGEAKMMTVPPPLKPLHGGFSFGNATRNNVVVDSKDSEKVLYGLQSPGPKYVPRYSHIDYKVHTRKIMSSDGTLKASRNAFKPGPGTYNPSVPGLEWIKPGKGAVLVGKEKDVHDVFTNSTRKARFIQKQFGVFSPGPKYNLSQSLGEFSPAFSFPRAGNTRLKKERKQAERRRKIFEARDPVLSSSESGFDELEEDVGREGGMGGVIDHGADNVYNPKYDLVEKRTPEVAFGRARRMPPTAFSDVPGPKYYPGLSHMSSTRRAVVPRIVKSSNAFGESKYRNRSVKGIDSPGVARYYPCKSTLRKSGTSFGGIKPMRSKRYRRSPTSAASSTSSTPRKKRNKNERQSSSSSSTSTSKRTKSSQSRKSSKNSNVGLLSSYSSRASSRRGGSRGSNSRGGKIREL